VKRAQRWRKNNKRKASTTYRTYYARKKFGLTLAEFDEMQSRPCEICGITGKKIRMCVDHCHVTGKVRDTLCTRCNVGIGMFQDDMQRVQSAVKYLRKHQRKKH
jgi:hypothetical protein